MINAREEFVNHLGSKPRFDGQVEVARLKCARIEYCHDFYTKGTTHLLPVNYSVEQFADFLNSLDFSYDNGYGLQELYGTIWFTDGTWSIRHEYDGSESWEYHSCPPIPDSLR